MAFYAMHHRSGALHSWE